jgi:hypothetical protein
MSFQPGKLGGVTNALINGAGGGADGVVCGT